MAIHSLKASLLGLMLAFAWSGAFAGDDTGLDRADISVRKAVAHSLTESYSLGGLKWGRVQESQYHTQQTFRSSAVNAPAFRWDSVGSGEHEIAQYESAGMGEPKYALKGFRWGIRSTADQQGFRWGIRSAADQQGFRWGIRSAADQQGFRWGIRSSADQQGFRWGIRSAADQQGFRWGIRSASNQQGFRWGIRSAAEQQGFRWGIRSTVEQKGYRWGIR
jgi:hypothetical protein